MKAFGIACLVVLFFGAFGVLGFVCHVTNTAQNSVTGVIDKTLDSDNVIYNYEYFHNAYNDIQAIGQQFTAAELAAQRFDAQFKSRTEMSREDKEESSRLHAVATGLQQERSNMVSTYNSCSAMVNRNIFKTNDVPSHIE